MDVTEPGWYTNGDGRQQWWDGEQWGPLAPQTISASTRRAAPQNAEAQQYVAPAHSGNPYQPIVLMHPPKKVLTAYLLLIFLGGLGAHRFYIASGGVGFILLLCWLVQVGSFIANQGTSTNESWFATIALIIAVVLMLFDLFRLGGLVRRYNERHQALMPRPQ